jgi:hypothetical protein
MTTRIGKLLEERVFDLGSACMGNGLSIYNRAKEVSGDYEKIAHIDPDRKVTWYIKNPPHEVVSYVSKEAQSDPSISASQPDQKVFNKPKEL